PISQIWPLGNRGVKEKLPKEMEWSKFMEKFEITAIFSIELTLLPQFFEWYYTSNASEADKNIWLSVFIVSLAGLGARGYGVLEEAISKKTLFHRLLRCSVVVDWKERDIISISTSHDFLVKISWRLALILILALSLVVSTFDKTRIIGSLSTSVGCLIGFLSLMYAKIIDMEQELVPFTRLIESPLFMKRLVDGWKDVLVITEKELVAYFIEKAEPSQKKFSLKVIKMYEENEKKRLENDKEGKTSKEPKPKSIVDYFVISHMDIDTWLNNYRQRPAEKKVKSSYHVFSYLKFIIYTSKAAESFGVKQPLKTISETAEMKTREEPEIKK
ncbi:hypothetical protein MP638_006427, partial [Amoeboaphelidium occidentale]